MSAEIIQFVPRPNPNRVAIIEVSSGRWEQTDALVFTQPGPQTIEWSEIIELPWSGEDKA